MAPAAAGAFHERFEDAARAADPEHALHDLAAALVVQGVSGPDILQSAEQFRSSVQAAGREADEDLVMYLMDTLTGWCSPGSPLRGIGLSEG